MEAVSFVAKCTRFTDQIATLLSSKQSCRTLALVCTVSNACQATELDAFSRVTHIAVKGVLMEIYLWRTVLPRITIASATKIEGD
jgi:hypothetical protein